MTATYGPTSRENAKARARYRSKPTRKPAVRDALELLTLPSYSPELKPVEECWRQLKASLSNRCFDSLSELTTAIDDPLAQLSVLKVRNYF